VHLLNLLTIPALVFYIITKISLYLERSSGYYLLFPLVILVYNPVRDNPLVAKDIRLFDLFIR
jgi:hypothetical protein